MKLYHLFPDLMNLYGDYGNLTVLKAALEATGETVEVVNLRADQLVDKSTAPSALVNQTAPPMVDKSLFSDAAFLYMGPGTEPARNAALSLLRPWADQLKDALVTRQLPALFTGNSWSILGQSITLLSGETLPGLGLFSYSTVEDANRSTGDALGRFLTIPDDSCPHPDGSCPHPDGSCPHPDGSCPHPDDSGRSGDPLPPPPDAPVVGFLNRCDVVKNLENPLFSLQMGRGNNGQPNTDEGFRSGRLLATHLIGPILVKNPHVLQYFLALLGQNVPSDESSQSFQAYQTTLAALQQRLANGH